MSRFASSALPVCLLITLGSIHSLLGTPLPPILTPAAGYYKGSVQVGMNSPAAYTNVSVYYTTDGSAPSNASTPFTGAIKLTGASTVVKAIAYDSGSSTYSPVTSGVFYVNPTATVALPVISPPGGNYITNHYTGITISCATPGATIYYTRDGSVPTTGSTQYTGQFQINQAKTISAIAVANASVTSGVAVAVFNYASDTACAAPTFSPNGGTFTGWETVTITSTTPNAVIRYTTDGTPVTANSPALIASPLSPSTMATKFLGNVTTQTKTFTLTARAFASGYADGPAASASFIANGVSTASLPPIDVTQHGVTPGDVNGKNAANMKTLLDSLQNTSPGYPYSVGARLFFPAGVYQFNGSNGVVPNNINNLVIDGQGSTLIFANGNAPFKFTNCSDVTIENMILDTALSSATPATLTESDSTGYDALLDPQFLAVNVAGPTGNPTGISEAFQYDPVQRALWPYGDIPTYSTNAPATVLGTQKVRVAYSPNHLQQGEYMNLHQQNYGALALNFNTCDGVNIDNVTVYGSDGMGITAGNCTDVTLDQVDILASPASGRLSSTANDGTHMTSCRGQVTYQDCNIQNTSDDCMNIQGFFYPITSGAAQDTSIVIENGKNANSPPSIVAGEVIEFLSSSLQQLGTAVVTQVVLPQTGNTETLYLSAGAPAKVDTTCLVDSLTWAPSLSVNRCNFLDDRGAGVKAKTNNVVAQNCRFAETYPYPIAIQTDVPGYYEAKGPTNVQVLNNSLEHCNYHDMEGSIAVGAVDTPNHTAAAGAINNVVIADNTIRDMDATGIYVASTINFDVLNNTLENNCIDPTYPNGNNAIYVEDASDGRVLFNTGLQSNYLRFAYDSYLPYKNVQNSTNPYNIQPFAINWAPSGAGGTFQLAFNDQCEQTNMPSTATVTVDLYKPGSGLYRSLMVPAGALASPTSWNNGSLIVSSGTSANLISTGLPPLPSGTYTIQVGMNDSAGAMSLLTPISTNVGTGKRVIVGTIVVSSGGAATFTSAQLDIKPTVSTFVQTAPNSQTASNQVTIGYTWCVNDYVPANCSTFAYLYDSNGNMVEDISSSDVTSTNPSSWTFGSQVVSTPQNINLTIPVPGTGATPILYNLVVGLKNSTGTVLQLSGDPKAGAAPQATNTGTITAGTGPAAPINFDPNTTTNLTFGSNTGFGM